MTSAVLRRVLFSAVFFSLAMTTLPQLVAGAREAAVLLRMTRRQRMEKVVGRFYTDVMRLRRELPPGEPVALILRQIRDVDIAVFFNYYVYPWTTRVYHDLGAYRNDAKRPQIVIGVDAARDPAVKWMPYDQLRAEHTGGTFVVRELKPFNPPLTSFDVALVCSLDGPAPDLYLTESIIENAGDSTAHVRLELFPSRRTRELELEPNKARSSNDLVHEMFGVMEQGWLRVTSDQPLRSGFWFANPGRKFAAPVPLINAARSARLESPGGAKFYVVNPSPAPLMVRMNDGEFFIQSHDVITGTAKGPMQIASDTPFYAFASWRDRDGRSLFAWQ